MSDEMTPREPATLTCAAGVPPERLSAWRDGLLPADQSEWLATHTAGCPACSERLRDYDRISAALRGQVIPRSAADPWPAMRLRLARVRRGGPRLRLGPRWGGIGALVAAALLVALFAGLLAHQASRRPTPASTATAVRATTTATTAPTTPTAILPGAWAQVDAYRNVSGLVVAPSNPRVAYQLFLAQQKGGGATWSLSRTDDQGATWSNIAPPSIPGVTYPDDIDGPFTGFVSPVDARVVFLILGIHSSTACGSTGGVAGKSSCQVEYVSADSGQSWRPLRLPVPGLMTAQVLKHGQVTNDIQAQGTRLYSEVFDWFLGTSGTPPPARLVASDDGGLTWRLVDAPFNAAGQGVYDYAATPSGSTIFAATEPQGQQIGPPVAEPLQLWRSNDAGATWTRIGQPPNNGLIAMRAALDAATNTPILYIETSTDKGQYLIQGSRNGANGGFTASPHLSQTGQDYAFLTTRADGSLLIANNGAIESWNLLDATTSWRQVAQTVDLLEYTSAFTQKQADGSTLLWLAGMTYSDSVVERAQLTG